VDVVSPTRQYQVLPEAVAYATCGRKPCQQLTLLAGQEFVLTLRFCVKKGSSASSILMIVFSGVAQSMRQLYVG
jgi:hypothetical protein